MDIIQAPIHISHQQMPVGISFILIGMSLPIMRGERHYRIGRGQIHIGGDVNLQGRGHIFVEGNRPNRIRSIAVALITATHAPTVLSPRQATPVGIHKNGIRQMRSHKHRRTVCPTTEQLKITE